MLAKKEFLTTDRILDGLVETSCSQADERWDGREAGLAWLSRKERLKGQRPAMCKQKQY